MQAEMRRGNPNPTRCLSCATILSSSCRKQLELAASLIIEFELIGDLCKKLRIGWELQALASCIRLEHARPNEACEFHGIGMETVA